MFKHLIDRLTYANVVATLALFIGLGGVSYAAITLPANSVGREQLRADAVGSQNAAVIAEFQRYISTAAVKSPLQ
jgi:hypothetical protein